MNKKTAVGAVIALALLVVLAGSVLSSSWGDMNDGPQSVPFGPDQNGDLAVNSINYQLFEVYGPLMVVLGILMFCALIASVAVSKEDLEKEKEGKQ
jgi:NADH:ubiquinone oxidoreductase subunit 6 (subunit J)